MSKILLVEDDMMVSQMVTDYLVAERHSVDRVFTGTDGLDRLKFYAYDLAILDWQLPQMSGLQVLKEYRDGGGKTPILMLTARKHVDDKESGFNTGADDYLTKPFEIRELAARVKALLRRPVDLVEPDRGVGDIALDYQKHTVTRGDRTESLLPLEFALLEFFMRYPGHYFTPEELLDKVWKTESESSIDAVRTCIKRLRTKIETADKPPLIVASRGLGYKLDVPDRT